MKKYLFIAALTMNFLACTSLPVKTDPKAPVIVTMKTDMHPQFISRAEYYEEMATGYVKNKQFEKAIENYKLSLLHNPESVSSHVGLAEVYIQQNKHLLALVVLQNAQKLDTKNIDVLKKTGDLYLSSGLYSKARDVYSEMLRLNNKNEEALWAVFYIYKLEKKYIESLETLAKIPADDIKTRSKILYEKALIARAQKEIPQYHMLLAEAMSVNPRDRDILLEFVKSSYEKRHYKEAMQALLSYSNTHTYDTEISQHLAFSAAQAENYKLAIREYEKQKTSNYDKVVDLNLKIAHCYFLMGDFENAEKIYLRLAIESNSDEARYYIGQIYVSKDKFSEATLVLRQIPISSQYYADAQIKMALYNKSLGNDDVSINILREAFIHRPDELEVFKAYGDFLIEQKRYVECVALLERAIQLFPRDEEVRLKMAYLHFRLSNQKSFKHQIKEALKINPNNAETYAMLSELWYLKDQDVDETMFFAKRALEMNSKNKNIKPILAWALMQKNHSTVDL